MTFACKVFPLILRDQNNFDLEQRGRLKITLSQWPRLEGRLEMSFQMSNRILLFDLGLLKASIKDPAAQGLPCGASLAGQLGVQAWRSLRWNGMTRLCLLARMR